MSLTSAFVLYAVLWSLFFMVALPVGLRTQGEAGEVVAGTPASAPVRHHLRTKAKWATVLAAVLWLVLFWIITSEQITVRDFDWMHRLPAAPDPAVPGGA